MQLRQPLSVGEGIMNTQTQPGLPSPSGVAVCVCVCVFLSVYSCIALVLCHFSAVCVSVCGPCVDRRSVFQHLAAGVLVCRENHPEPLCHSSLGRTGPPPYLDPSPRPGCCFLNSPGAPFFWVPNPGCSLFSCRQRQLGPPDLS